MKTKRSITAKDVANVFLKLSEPEVGDSLTNLKIQKLLYYTQGFHLAIFGVPLFKDKIVAWEHGPVVESIYQEFKKYGSNSIDIPDNVDTSIFSKDQLDLISEINDIFGQFSAWKLRNMTHSERPWNVTERNDEIDQKLLKEYFLTQINS